MQKYKNSVELSGVLESNFTEYHTLKNKEPLLFSYLLVARKSGTKDRVPIIITKREYDTISPETWNEKIHIYGKIIRVLINKKFNIAVFVKNLDKYQKDEDVNSVSIDGFIDKDPIVRVTPLGKLISDIHFILALSKAHVPVIVWNSKVKSLKSISINKIFRIEGRFQSRIYTKVYEDGTSEDIETYEISTYKLYSYNYNEQKQTKNDL